MSSLRDRKNNNSAITAWRKFGTQHDLRDINQASGVSLIIKLVLKFQETGSVMDKPKSEQPRSSRTDENVESARQSVRETPVLNSPGARIKVRCYY